MPVFIDLALDTSGSSRHLPAPMHRAKGRRNGYEVIRDVFGRSREVPSRSHEVSRLDATTASPAPAGGPRLQYHTPTPQQARAPLWVAPV
jgi:hypothetical protein